MTTKNRNLMIAAGLVASGILLLWKVVPSATPPGTSGDPFEIEGGEKPYAANEGGTSVATPSSQLTPPVEAAADMRTYSLGLHELSGLTENTPPGTRVDIWAAWGPPLTEKPQMQRLLKDVVIEKIQPPLIPEGPAAVVISLAPGQVEDMLWGDKYGDLAAVVRR